VYAVRLASTFYGQRERTEHEAFVAPVVLLVVLGSGIPPESGVTRTSCSLPVLHRSSGSIPLQRDPIKVVASLPDRAGYQYGSSDNRERTVRVWI
jgi:hypothetical protein